MLKVKRMPTLAVQGLRGFPELGGFKVTAMTTGVLPGPNGRNEWKAAISAVSFARWL